MADWLVEWQKEKRALIQMFWIGVMAGTGFGMVLATIVLGIARRLAP